MGSREHAVPRPRTFLLGSFARNLRKPHYLAGGGAIDRGSYRRCGCRSRRERQWASVGRDRCLVRPFDDVIEAVRAVQNADWCDAYGRATPVVIERDSCRVSYLVEFPKRLHAGMNTLLAREQLPADAGMSDFAVAQDAIVCCAACKSQPIVRISASFDPSAVRVDTAQSTRAVVRPTSL
jgi:hypothetical protein